MSGYLMQELRPSGVGKSSDSKLIKRDSLETDSVPRNDEAVSKSQEMRRQIEPLSNNINQTDQEKYNSYNENTLCREVNQMKITPRGTSSDDQHIQHKPVSQEQNYRYESGSNTSDLLQHAVEGDHGAGGHDVSRRRANTDDAAGGACGGNGNVSEDMGYSSYQSEIEAKVHAFPFGDDISQTATTTRQESLPTTKPKDTVVTSQTARHSQQVKDPHTPTQESTSQALPKPTCQEPPIEEEQYDVLLLYSEHDKSEAQQFLDIAERFNWKVATSDEFLPTRTKFHSFEGIFQNSSYTVLLLTSNFIADVWCEHRYQAALTQSIENPAKKCSVIPIVCQENFKLMPMALSIFTSVKLNHPKIEKILQRTIRKDKRLQREKAAGLTTRDTAPNHHGTLKVQTKNEVASMSMDDIYHQQRPELQPGTPAAQIMSRHCFSKLCVYLDAPHPLQQDWRGLASSLGFTSRYSLNTLSQDKSPTAKILECFFQQQSAKQTSQQGILMELALVLKEMHRDDAVQLLRDEK